MVYCGHLTIIPGNRNCIPTQFGDAAAVSGIASPINAVTSLEAFRFGGGAVAELVGNEGGVVSGVFNLESSDVEASDWRPRHDKHYHEA